MAALSPPVCEFGWSAPEFALPGTDGQRHSLSDLRGPNGTLVMFICNHCPFVIGIRERLVADGRALQERGIGVLAICANDAEAYPQDSFENMVKTADQWGLPFPYLHDADQQVARAYGAVCTPDFFGFNADLELQYRGRLDGAGQAQRPADMPAELLLAMTQISETGQGPREQIPSMGCSIKWKTP